MQTPQNLGSPGPAGAHPIHILSRVRLLWTLSKRDFGEFSCYVKTGILVFFFLLAPQEREPLNF